MPTYDYRCAACGHTFEKFQSITARPIRTCPRCRKRKVKRLIGTGAGILFKGSGFYQTDYRSESYRKAAEKEKAGEGGAKPAGEGDAKPASESKPGPGAAANDGKKSSGETGSG